MRIIETTARLLRAAFFAWICFLFPNSFSAVVSIDYTLRGTDLDVHLSLAPDLSTYYILNEGADLEHFAPRSAYFTGGSNIWNFTLPIEGDSTRFWAIESVNIARPLDLDNDGIDDFYELTHGIDPLDPADAARPSGFTDFDGNPLTWLEQYRYHFQHEHILYDAVGREVSTFNFGQATANFEGISREVSLFATPQPDADGDGIDDAFEIAHGLNPTLASDANLPSGFTIDFPEDRGRPLTWLELYHFHFGKNTVLYNTVSREVSVFNFGQPTANFEAISREVSLFNVPQPDTDGDGIDDAFEINHSLNPFVAADAATPSGFTDDFPNREGRPLTWLEVYRFHFQKGTLLYDTVSREVSVFNFGQPAANFEAISHEISVFNFGQPTAPFEAISREISLFNEP